MLPSHFLLLVKMHNGNPVKIDFQNKNLKFLLDKGWIEKELKTSTRSTKIPPFQTSYIIHTGKYLITSKGKSSLYKSLGTLIAAIFAIVSLFFSLYSWILFIFEYILIYKRVTY